MFENDWEGTIATWEDAKATLKELQASQNAELNLMWGDFQYVAEFADVLEAYVLVTEKPLPPLQSTLVKACNYQDLIANQLHPFYKPIDEFPSGVNLDAVRKVVWDTPKVDALGEDSVLFMVFATKLYEQLTQADLDIERFTFARCPDCWTLFIPTSEGQIYDSSVCEEWAQERARLTEELRLLTEKQNERLEQRTLAGTWQRAAGKIHHNAD